MTVKKTILMAVTCIGLLSFILFASSAQNRKVAKPSTISAYATQVAQLDQEISSLHTRATNMPSSWFALELAALKHLDRGRLTGNYHDYAEAQILLDKAFALSGELGGPHMTRAGLNFSLHRLTLLEADLAAMEQKLLLSNSIKANILGLKADVFFYQGDYKQAFELYQEALALSKNSANLFRLAHYYWRTGDFKLAEQFLDEAATNTQDTPRLNAFFHLHRGLLDLDRGRYDEALAHYQAADNVFDGWWLIQEHIAEIYTLQNRLSEARAVYEDVIFQTGNPEFMDALASIAITEGKLSEAANWQNQARAIYERQLAQFPEASYGHALGHYLGAKDGANKAIELAEANYQLRPYGEAAVLLAQVYIQAGQLDKAQVLIEKTLLSSWESADLHATAALIFQQLGNKTRAQLEQQKALTINPHALANLSWLAGSEPISVALQ